MGELKCHENYPLRTVILANIVSLAIYMAGAFILYQLGWVWLIPYGLCISWLEMRVIRRSCVNCYYYGKVCAFGKGKLSRLLFPKGEAERFKRDKITWKDVAPDFMVALVPAVIGVILLIIDFTWPILSAVVLLVLLASLGNGLVRGSLACKYCKQREIGCPAEQLFNRDRAKA